MLTVKDLVITDYQHDIILVDNLSFSVNPNDKIAIIGSEGSGKSTLLSIIRGYKLDYVFVKGEIIRPNVISYLDQNIKYKYSELTVFEYLSHENENIYDYLEDIIKLLHLFDLNYDEIFDRKINTFSGGEAVKIGLVKSLMVNPDILLLDEPTNDLDFKTLVFIEHFLIETNIPVIFISHDQRLLENVANGIIHLEHINKKTKAKTSFLQIDYKKYKEIYQVKFNNDLMVARKQRADYDKKMDKFKQIYQKVEHRQNQAVRDPHTAQLLKKKIHSLKSQEKRYLKEKDNFIDIPQKEEAMNIFFENQNRINPNKVIIDLNNDMLTLKNKKVISNINLTLRAKDKVVIIGDNGVGKTTLMNHIFYKLNNEGMKVGYITQNYLDILDKDVTAVTYLLNSQKKYNESRIRQILGSLGIKKNEMIAKIESLSEGTKLKVLLTNLIANEYDVLLLDEPTRNISPLNQDELYNLFLSFDGAILAVTHDRAFIENVFDEVYEFSTLGLIKN